MTLSTREQIEREMEQELLNSGQSYRLALVDARLELATLADELANATQFSLEIVAALGYRTDGLEAELKAGKPFPSQQIILEAIGQLEELKVNLAALREQQGEDRVESALDRAVSEAVQNAIADFHHNDAENYKLVEADFEREKNEQVSQAVAGMREAIAIEAINHDWFYIGTEIAKSIRQLPNSAADQGREQIEKDAFCNGVQSLLTEIQKVVPYWQEGRKVSDIVGQIQAEAVAAKDAEIAGLKQENHQLKSSGYRSSTKEYIDIMTKIGHREVVCKHSGVSAAKQERPKPSNHGKSFSTFEQRVDWLLAHPIFLTGKLNERKIVTAMKHDGLVSKKTYWLDVKLDDELRQAKLRLFAEHTGW